MTDIIVKAPVVFDIQQGRQETTHTLDFSRPTYGEGLASVGLFITMADVFDDGPRHSHRKIYRFNAAMEFTLIQDERSHSDDIAFGNMFMAHSQDMKYIMYMSRTEENRRPRLTYSNDHGLTWQNCTDYGLTSIFDAYDTNTETSPKGTQKYVYAWNGEKFILLIQANDGPQTVSQWSSPDGATWTKDQANVSALTGGVIEYGGAMRYLNGLYVISRYTNNTYWSKDLITWYNSPVYESYPVRYGVDSVVWIGTMDALGEYNWIIDGTSISGAGYSDYDWKFYTEFKQSIIAYGRDYATSTYGWYEVNPHADTVTLLVEDTGLLYDIQSYYFPFTNAPLSRIGAGKDYIVFLDEDDQIVYSTDGIVWNVAPAPLDAFDARAVYVSEAFGDTGTLEPDPCTMSELDLMTHFYFWDKKTCCGGCTVVWTTESPLYNDYLPEGVTEHTDEYPHVAMMGFEFYKKLEYTADSEPSSFSIVSGALPSGLEFNTSTAEITGIPLVGCFTDDNNVPFNQWFLNDDTYRESEPRWYTITVLPDCTDVPHEFTLPLYPNWTPYRDALDESLPNVEQKVIVQEYQPANDGRVIDRTGLCPGACIPETNQKFVLNTIGTRYKYNHNTLIDKFESEATCDPYTLDVPAPEILIEED